MIRIERYINLILLIIVINSCHKDGYDIKEIVVSNSLIERLNETIDHIDSSDNDLIKSILIEFEKNDGDLFVTITGDFTYYDSKAMDGYFDYRNKHISVYGLKGKTKNTYIVLGKLHKGKIDDLTDYDYSQLNKVDKYNPPLPPPPPREPYYRRYLIVDRNNFKLFDFNKY